jgi:hypothetical protein
MTSAPNPSKAQQHNHCHHFVLLDKSDVPEEWKHPVSKKHVQTVADKIGLLPEHIMFYICYEVPDTNLGRQYQHFNVSTSTTESVPVVVTGFQEFANYGDPTGTRRLREFNDSMKNAGHPCHFIQVAGARPGAHSPSTLTTTTSSQTNPRTCSPTASKRYQQQSDHLTVHITSYALSLVAASKFTVLAGKAKIAAVTSGTKFSRSPQHLELLAESTELLEKIFDWGMDTPSSGEEIETIPSWTKITVTQLHQISIIEFVSYHAKKAAQKIARRLG